MLSKDGTGKISFDTPWEPDHRISWSSEWLGRAFQYAGARSVLMSLWSVAENSSVMLVESFFRHIREGKNKLDALKLARREIRNSGFDHPFFWAPFILVGETSVSGPSLRVPAQGNKPVALPPANRAAAVELRQLGRDDQSDHSEDMKLLQAARCGDADQVTRLLRHGARIQCTDEKYHGTPLHWSAYFGHRKIVSILLQKECDINAVNRYGQTALIVASWAGRDQVLRLLLTRKADVTVRDTEGRTAMEWAIVKGHPKVGRILKNYRPTSEYRGSTKCNTRIP